MFKVPVEEREILIEAEPDTFFVTPHYQGHPMVLVRPDRLDLVHALARVDYPRKLPHVLPIDDVARLIEAAPGPGLQYKAALSIAYGAGLRSEEVVMLRVANIDSKRMLIRVEQGAARQSRCDARSPRLSRYRRSCLA